MDRPTPSILDCKIGWICALPFELAAAAELLDEEYDYDEDELPESDDLISYSFGRIGHCNILIGCLPVHPTGIGCAAVVAEQMRLGFPSIEVYFIVGIGSGVPNPENDIRLGDVVVGQPQPAHGGVLQIEPSDSTASGYVETAHLGQPPRLLLRILARVQSNHLRRRNHIATHLSKFNDIPDYGRDPTRSDLLYEPTYDHVGGSSCEQCNKDKIITRTLRSTEAILIHYGTIVSSTQPVSDGSTRDQLSEELGGVLCIESELAGLKANLPCLVIRGICDYSDSHRSKEWRFSAAASASAYAKELIMAFPRTETIAPLIKESISEGSNGSVRHSIENEGNVANQAWNQTVHGGIHISQVISEPDFQEALPMAAEAAFNSFSKQYDAFCLEGTRVQALEEIYAWADAAEERCIFWLNGMAGTGKSTIARTVASHFYQKRLTASFFFSRGGGDVANVTKFFPTIARQFANLSPELGRYIGEAVSQHKDIASQTLRDQWDQLILVPISKLDSTSTKHPPMIIVDALDECERNEDVKLLLQLLSESKHAESTKLRIFITSRPETPIRLGFRNMPAVIHHDLILHDISRKIVDSDIRKFFESEFGEIRQASEYLDADWPGSPALDSLVQKAHGLFIYAATICRFIKSNDFWHPQELLEVLLPSKEKGHKPSQICNAPSASPTAELDLIYLQILEHSVKGIKELRDKEEIAREFKKVVGSIVLSYEPLSATALAELLRLSVDRVYLRLHHLRSIFQVPEDKTSPVRVLHPSFRDFLIDIGRCSNPLFSVDEQFGHGYLKQVCLERLSRSSEGLKADICGFGETGILMSEIPGSKVKQHIPGGMEYACLFWAYHLRDQKVCHDMVEEIHNFLQQHLLHWLEALALIRKLSEGVHSLEILELMENVQRSSRLSVFINDAKRTLLANRQVIEEAPLQIYSASLIFSPRNNSVRKECCSGIALALETLSETQDGWSSLLQTLEGHTAAVKCIAFSADGGTLISASEDGTIRLWDPTTGASIKVLGEHQNSVNAIALSRNGNLLASGSSDGTVTVWDLKTQDVLWKHHVLGDGVSTVCFSHDDRRLLSAATSGALLVREVATGVTLQNLGRYKDPVEFLALSNDSKTAVSISSGTVYIWDIESRARLNRTLENTESSKNARFALFTSDNKILMLQSGSNVSLIDTRTWKCHKSLLCDPEGPIADSQDGNLLAVPIHDQIKVYDWRKDDTIATFRVPTGCRVKSLNFSSDGTILYALCEEESGSFKRHPNRNILACDLRDTSQGWIDFECSQGEYAVFGSDVERVTISRYGEVIASLGTWRPGSRSGDNLWNANFRAWEVHFLRISQKLVLKPKRMIYSGPSENFDSIVLSTDGSLLLLATDQGRILCLDTKTAGVTVNLDSCYRQSSTVPMAISSDNKMVAYVSSDGTITLDETNQSLYPLLDFFTFWPSSHAISLVTGHSAPVTEAIFSPDDKMIASCSQDGTILLWEVSTGLVQRNLSAGSNIIPTDGLLLRELVELPACGHPPQSYGLVRSHPDWWLSNSMTCVETFECSPDGKLIVTLSVDATVMLWDSSTGDTLGMLPRDSAMIKSISFSSAGNFIASSNKNNSIELRKPTSRDVLHTFEGHFGPVLATAFSPNGELLASASADQTIKIWQTSYDPPAEDPRSGAGAITTIILSHDGSMAATLSEENNILLWNTSNARLIHHLRKEAFAITPFCFSPDGRYLLSSSADRIMLLWDTSSGALVKMLLGHSEMINAVAYSPDGRIIASASRDCSVRLWDANAQRFLQRLSGHSGSVWAVEFSGDSKRLFSAARDGSLRMWDVATKIPMLRLSSGSHDLTAFSLSRNGELALTAYSNSTVLLWNLKESNEVQIKTIDRPQKDRICALAFSPDGTLAVSTSGNGKVTFWDLATGSMKGEVEESHAVRQLSFTDDGLYINTERGTILNPFATAAASSSSGKTLRRVFVDDRWIFVGDERAVLIPSDYRPTAVLVRGDLLILGHRSGEISTYRIV